MDGLNFNLLDNKDVNWLERSFEEVEVLEALKDLNGNKAPGLDGFSIAFFQSCWDVVKANVMGTFHSFHEAGLFEQSLNATFIALIPKLVFLFFVFCFLFFR